MTFDVESESHIRLMGNLRTTTSSTVFETRRSNDTLADDQWPILKPVRRVSEEGSDLSLNCRSLCQGPNDSRRPELAWYGGGKFFNVDNSKDKQRSAMIYPTPQSLDELTFKVQSHRCMVCIPAA